MRAPRAIVVVLTAAFVLTSFASASADATKQRVQIDMKIHPKKTFALATLQTGALKRDSGTHACPGDPDDLGTVQRDGQEAFRWECRAWMFTGKRGTLVLRSQFTWIEAGGPYNIATGTWKVVRGTGQYAGITGGGRSAQVGGPSGWLARYQGFLTSP
jgi:hypothetical protein